MIAKLYMPTDIPVVDLWAIESEVQATPEQSETEPEAPYYGYRQVRYSTMVDYSCSVQSRFNQGNSQWPFLKAMRACTTHDSHTAFCRPVPHFVFTNSAKDTEWAKPWSALSWAIV